MLLKIFLISLNIFIIYPLPSILFLSGGIFYLAALVLSKFPLKKINYFYGYRTKASMKSQESWNFSQKLHIKKNEIYITIHFYYRCIFDFFKHRVNVVSLAWYNNIGFNACFNDS